MTDLSKMADGLNEAQALLGHKVIKQLELEGFRRCMARMERTSWTGLAAGAWEIMERELCEPQ